MHPISVGACGGVADAWDYGPEGLALQARCTVFGRVICHWPPQPHSAAPAYPGRNNTPSPVESSSQ